MKQEVKQVLMTLKKIVSEDNGLGSFLLYLLQCLRLNAHKVLSFKAEFLDVVHQVIRKAIEEGNDDRLTGEAMQIGEGWMHINGQCFSVDC